jgi:transcriptional regulator with XRE-family HTH domain
MTEQELCRILGKNIKRYRGIHTMSQESLAGKINISTNFLSDIETGKSWVSPKTLINLASVLQVEVPALLKSDDTVSAEGTDIVTQCTNEALIAVKHSMENLQKYYLLRAPA